MRRIISLILTFVFFIETPLAYSAVVISPTERSENLNLDMRNSDTPSDLPVAGYEEYFDKEKINVISNQDLSGYSNMRGFIGYGIYDISENQCQFLEVPGQDKYSFDLKFQKIEVSNGHSYGVAYNKMTYGQCSTLAQQFGGYPVSIDSLSENNFIDSSYNTESWVGATINSCSDVLYMNSTNKNQNFTNWRTASEGIVCDINKKNILMNISGTWEKTNSELLNNCVVEWNSETYYRPIQVCAPWWTVVRDYKKQTNSLYNEKELREINQADIPVNISLCVRYNENAVSVPELPHRDYTCTGYYSIEAAPECARNIMQAQCYVNECDGYVKDVCQLKDSDIVGKGYVKGQKIVDGVVQETVTKAEVTTYLYSCPPPATSLKDCLESAQVTVWPKECPNSFCNELKSCLLASNDDNSSETCRDTYRCEKIYPEREYPLTVTNGGIDNDGNLVKLFGTCSTEGNSAVLDFVPNIMQRTNKICLEREITVIDENISQRCILERPESFHTVNIAFDETDIYENNPDCIRTDRVEDAQLDSTVILKLSEKGYFKHRISKVFSNQDTEVLTMKGRDSYMIQNVFLDNVNLQNLNNPFVNSITSGQYSPQITSATDPLIAQNNITVATSGASCGEVSCPYGFEDPAFYDLGIATSFERRSLDMLMTQDALTVNASTVDVVLTKDNNIDYLNLLSHTMDIVNYPGMTASVCTNFGASKGFGSWVVSSTFFLNTTTNATSCTIVFKSTPYDTMFKYVKTLTGQEMLYAFKDNMTKKSCMERAVCLGGTFNEANFASMSSVGECIVIMDSASDDTSAYEAILSAQAGCDVPMSPIATNGCFPTVTNGGNVVTDLNGFESVLVLEDYLTGPWGYYTNFNTLLPQPNEVTITTASITDKKVFPLVNPSKIYDYQKAMTKIKHYGWRHLSESATLDVIALAGLLTGGFLTLILIIFFKSKKMHEQWTHWVIYRNPPRFAQSEFEKRETLGASKTIGESGNTATLNTDSRIYLEGKYHTGRLKNINPILAAYLEAKKSLFVCGGWEENEFEIATHAAERTTIFGTPKCKWYKPWCTKKNTYYASLDTDIKKYVNTVYFGATNSTTVVLPYTGDFDVEAYDKYDTLLARVSITKESFLNVSGNDSVKFAKVNFGPQMQLSNNMNTCLLDNMVEWGGGVSGGYIENGTTGINDNCPKSDDNYVQEHAMVKLKIKPTNMPDKEFIHEFLFPMPFANRVFLATLDKLQERKYLCYGAFSDCNDEDYEGEQP